MAKAILICGKICSGKTCYASTLQEKHPYVLFSSDELISALFHPNENDYHDTIITNVHSYLFNKSLEVLRSGCDVILDWGFWTKADRDKALSFYRSRGFEAELHFLDISRETWQRNIETRNRAVLADETTDYYVDE